MYSHASPGYVCPFCLLVRGEENPDSQLRQTDIVFQTLEATAVMATRKWPDNPGHVLIIPNRHFENIYDLPAGIAREIHSLSREIALAMKAEYGCDGIALQQSNEPAGDQKIWHYHLHVIARFVYLLSLGSQQGNRHVHWHIAPLPYGIPFKEQQLEALRVDNGILDMSDREMAELAVRLRQEMLKDPE